MRQRSVYWLCALIMGSAAGQVRAVDPDPCIPPDTLFAMKVRPRQILTSALAKDLGWDKLLKTTLAAEKPVQEFLEAAGLRLDRDVESILLCMPTCPILEDPDIPPMALDPKTGKIIQPKTPAEEKSCKPWLMVIEGKFSQEKIATALDGYGKSPDALVEKLKWEGPSLLRIDSPLGQIYLAFEGVGRILVSNQLDRLKGSIDVVRNKQVSAQFRASMKNLTGHESFWLVHSVEGDLKKQLQIEMNNNPQMIWKDLDYCQIGLTVSDTVHGELTYSNQNPISANAIKAEISTDVQIWRKEVEEFLKDPTSLIPKDVLANREYFWTNIEALWELTIPYSAARLSKLEVQGNNTVFVIKANRKSLEPLLQTFGLLEK